MKAVRYLAKRVVVTGIGFDTPLGKSVEFFWEQIKNGKSAIRRLDFLEKEDLAVQIAANVTESDCHKFMPEKEMRRLDRFSQFAVSSAMKAILDANFTVTPQNSERTGVIVGTGIGGMETMEQQMRNYINKGFKRISPFFLPMALPNMASGQISMIANIKGPSSSVITACAAGAHSIGEASEIIRRGDADCMLAGASESSVTPFGIAAFAAMRALSTKNETPSQACRPFDVNRDGFVMGEGAAILFLESLESALKRGARIYAELVAYGQSADAHHITAPAPEGEGAYRAMKMAIQKSGLKPTDINYINAHGTSTPANDVTETQAIKKAFSQHAYQLKVSSTKAMTGHLLGAAGSTEAAITVLAIYNKWVPATLNLDNPDPQCDLDYVPHQGAGMEIDAAMTNSLGFGGQNCSLIFKKFKGA